ncbi:hypothetical protein [Schaalia sp. lx-100]|uniref:hypothetical protein n=1 Tax=Schaalia sp. lx-100 TaxID=2899081 RepID=UPI001E2EF9BA|nr:hypothetical protein [Schaalia sp. lx-100]MCD4558237.1 hypothetical protein [Schaalia sp. lx-100]
MGIYSPKLTKIITPNQLASCYGVSNIVHAWENPYGTNPNESATRGHGLLLTTGAGMMMSLMDQTPGCSYAADLGGGRNVEGMTKFLEATARLYSHILIIAWFTASDPKTWEDVYLKPLDGADIGYWSNVELPISRRFNTVGEALEWSKGFTPAFSPDAKGLQFTPR